MTDQPTNWHEAGCARDCTEQHTYTWGRCALAPETSKPEPTISIGRVEMEADGCPGIVMRSVPLSAWHGLITVAKWVSRGKSFALDADPDIAPAYPDATARFALGALHEAGLFGAPAPTTEQPKTFPSIRGRCPACRSETLFVGTGGWITCSLIGCPNPTATDELLHRTAPTVELREHLAAALLARIKQATVSDAKPWNAMTSLLAANEFDLADTALAALLEYLDIGDAEAWCKVCRRLWDGKHHRCEGDAEQRLAQTRDACLQLLTDADEFATRHNPDCECERVPATREAANRILAAIDQPKEQSA